MTVSVLIDDDALQARLIVDNLRSIEFTVLWTRQGWDGLVTAHQVRPDLIILDWDVPQALELLVLLRSNRSLSKTCLLLIATRCPPRYYHQKLNVSGCIEKPVDADVLIQQVQRIVQPAAVALAATRPAVAQFAAPAPAHPYDDLEAQDLSGAVL